MKILAIETSCDETGVAVIEASGGLENPCFSVLGNALLSQAQKHAEYGGVYPNLAKRLHAQNLVPMLTEALRDAGMLVENSQPLDNNIQQRQHSNILENVRMLLERDPELFEQLKKLIGMYEKPNVDAIAVTIGPGLEPALWVGLNFAKALSKIWDLPFIPVNHMEGHIVSVLMDTEQAVSFPALALLISGGHTELVLIKSWMDYERIGQTRDDAVGEAFDKVARLLDLPYPGGPEISKLAEKARREDLKSDISLPRPMIDSDDYDFSFSGLKTAVRYTVEQLLGGEASKLGLGLDEHTRACIAREFEDAAVDVLVSKTKKALEEYGADTLIVGGGVIANKKLREAFTELAKEYKNLSLLIPEMSLTTDNAVMIGMAGYFRSLNQNSTNTYDVRAVGNLKLA